jgi:hypothetical protein
MNRTLVLRASLALLALVIGNLQAWDSGVHEAGLLIVFLVSLAIALPAVALLLPLKPVHFIGSFVLALVLLAAARLISPIPLPGLFLVLLPAGTGLIFSGIFEQKLENK